MKLKKRQAENSAANKNSLTNIQKITFRSQIILIVTLALFLGITGSLINVQFETKRRDQNLQNVAEAIAQSPMLAGNEEMYSAALYEYLDSLKDTLEDIDVISVVDAKSKRIYHSNHELIGTVYDGTMPTFEENSQGYYATNDSGPSGTQRRAYAAIYDEKGNYVGFVMAIMLMENIKSEIFQIILTFTLITTVAILMELLISAELSGKIKESLLGYEPDVFTAMFRMRDNILESLDEGIIAADGKGTIQFVNKSALDILKINEKADDLMGKSLDTISENIPVLELLKNRDTSFANNSGDEVLIDTIPIRKDGRIIGSIGILHDRAEYTKLMEDLTGTRYLVDSMRANNHDFTNKLHVILGLIQMEMYDEATSYIQNITMVQRETISKIMNAVNEPAVAALLIGKIARASELNIKFILREGCCYSSADMNLPSELLVTIIGNLIDNAFEAMNVTNLYDGQKELMFGIYSKPGAVLITVDDTGCGIDEEDMERIFENGFSTKGDGRGTGLYQVKTITENIGGKICVESQRGVGTSFSVSFQK